MDKRKIQPEELNKSLGLEVNNIGSAHIWVVHSKDQARVGFDRPIER